jgi:hypothetical protein
MYEPRERSVRWCFLGLASFAVLLGRAEHRRHHGTASLPPGAACVFARHLFRIPAPPGAAAAPPADPALSPRRVRLARLLNCRRFLLMACVLVPEHWYRLRFFLGIVSPSPTY